jgi:hypothetical protein
VIFSRSLKLFGVSRNLAWASWALCRISFELLPLASFFKYFKRASTSNGGFMVQLPFIAKFNEPNLEKILKELIPLKFLLKENREDFSGEFPMHTRYFSNGDRPLVALINLSGHAVFGYEVDKYAKLEAGEFIFFDDSEPHCWIFKNCNLEMLFYRLKNPEGAGNTSGDYCLDNYF